jgi:hypothetical protein
VIAPPLRLLANTPPSVNYPTIMKGLKVSSNLYLYCLYVEFNVVVSVAMFCASHEETLSRDGVAIDLTFPEDIEKSALRYALRQGSTSSATERQMVTEELAADVPEVVADMAALAGASAMISFE